MLHFAKQNEIIDVVIFHLNLFNDVFHFEVYFKFCFLLFYLFFVSLVAVSQMEKEDSLVERELNDDLRNVVGNLNISFDDGDRAEENCEKFEVINIIIV